MQQGSHRSGRQIKRFVRQQKKLGLWSSARSCSVYPTLDGHRRPQGLSDQNVSSAGHPAWKRSASPPTAAPDMVYLSDRTSPQRFDLLRRMREAASRTPALPESMRPCTASRTRRTATRRTPSRQSTRAGIWPGTGLATWW